MVDLHTLWNRREAADRALARTRHDDPAYPARLAEWNAADQAWRAAWFPLDRAVRERLAEVRHG